MGKKSAKKDRAYITASEWRNEGGGHVGRLHGAGANFKRLPFNCCAISFQPFEDPVCAPDGTTMDIINAVPYITKHKKHPVTGQPLTLKDLIKLHFHRNADGELACPVLNKVFNENTHIVAIKPTGNVYCWEAVDELCLKPKNLRDLTTDEPFSRKDLIHLQDPQNLAGKNLAEFDHVKFGRSVEDEGERAAREMNPMFGINTTAITQDAQRALSALGSAEATAAFAAGGGGKKAQAERALAEAKAANKIGEDEELIKDGKNNNSISGKSDPRLRSTPRDLTATVAFKPGAHTWNSEAPSAEAEKAAALNKTRKLKGGGDAIRAAVPSPYSATFIQGNTSTGAASKSFTSTSMPVATRNERTMLLKQLQPRQKGYLRLHTTLGDINVELHCDVAPKTCENFMALAEGGYYTNTVFHRSIKNFMLQGGDPTGTGKGGESVFGPTFEDEFAPQLLHDARGVLSMANSGKNTNGSQFFILYKSAPHLNYKHSVFGRVVGGFEVLTLCEKIETDDEDRPLQEVKITGATVFVNPYKDLIEEEKKKEENDKKKEKKALMARAASEEEVGAWFSDPGALGGGGNRGSSGGGGVGKYLKNSKFGANVDNDTNAAAAGGGGGGSGVPAAKRAKKASTGAALANFDAW